MTAERCSDMTLREKILAIALGMFVLLAVFAFYYKQQGDVAIAKAQAKTDAVQAVLEQSKTIFDTAQKAITQANVDKEQIQKDYNARIAQIERERQTVMSPQQFAAGVSALLPNLPQSVQVQNVPATATSPATQQIIIPQVDIPAFQTYKAVCDETSAKLTKCTQDANENSVILDKTKVQLATRTDDLAVMTKDRDDWRNTAKGGTFWHRFGEGSKHSLCGMAGGAAGVKTAQSSTPVNGAIAGISTTAGCEVTMWLIGRIKK